MIHDTLKFGREVAEFGAYMIRSMQATRESKEVSKEAPDILTPKNKSRRCRRRRVAMARKSFATNVYKLDVAFGV